MHKSIYLVFFLFIGCESAIVSEEQKHTRPLFNGKNLDGWVVKIAGHEVGEDPYQTFRVNNGVIEVRYDGYEGDFNGRFAHLYFEEPFDYFHLTLEYRFVEGWEETAPIYTFLNSGVMFYSQDPKSILRDQNFPISVEMQFLGHLPNTEVIPKTGNMCSPGTDVVIGGQIAKAHCVNSIVDARPIQEWVKAELIVRRNGSVTQKINEQIVLEYAQPSIGGGTVTGYDESVKVDGTALSNGFIALQAEAQNLDFRNIKISPL